MDHGDPGDGSVLFKEEALSKTQADDAFTISLGASHIFCCHQIQVEVSATPSAGTLKVAVRSPNSTAFTALDGSFDLTGTELLKTFGPCYAAEIRFTPSGFDSDKTYNVIVTSGIVAVSK
jgi:hypothetical protein